MTPETLPSGGSAAANPWVDWWSHEGTLEDDHASRNAAIFVDAIVPLLELGPDSVVLDVGCGGGWVEARLRERVGRIAGLDVSAAALAEARRRLGDDPRLKFFPLDPASYTRFPVVPDGTVTAVIVLSVIQYYAGLQEVADLVREARRVCQLGGRLLIADVSDGGGVVEDVSGLLETGLRERRLFKEISEMARLAFSRYSRLRASHGLLAPTDAELLEAARHGGADKARILRVTLTLNRRRKHLLVNF